MITRNFLVGFITITGIVGLFSCSETMGKKSEGKTTASFFENLTSGSAVSNLSVDDYMRWVEDKNNGLKVEKTIGDFTFSTLYKPYEYLTAGELRGKELTEKKFKETLNGYKGLQYYTYKIMANDEQQELLKVGISNNQEYYNRLEYLAFEMKKDFKLIEGKDTLNCVLYHYERVFGLAPYATMVLGFPLTKQEEEATGKITHQDKTIVYEDKLFKSGNIYMTIDADKLNNIPAFSIQ